MRLRALVLRALVAARKGHFGSSMSILEVIRVLYDNILRHDPSNPNMETRDRFVLSKGHGCLGLYAVLAYKGYFPCKDLDSFCKPGSSLGGHPERGLPGVEASTGSLGHGLSLSVGIALSSKILRSPFRVFCLVGDGELSEGSIWEACLSAGNNKLDNLTLLIDRNRYQIFGSTAEVNDIEPLPEKLKAFNFDVCTVDGHSLEDLTQTLSQQNCTGRPRAVICNTIKGKGFSFAENNVDWHYKFWLTEEEITLFSDYIKKYER